MSEQFHKLDTPSQVFFYEQDFYVLSNFSAFTILWKGRRFDTSEAAYHWMKFEVVRPTVAAAIRAAPSAHEAFKLAERNKHLRRPDWDDVKVDIMRGILRAKVEQHEYVRRKLLATGDRELIEDSWRDDFWGWGPNRDGQNILGKLWMEVRAQLRASDYKATSAALVEDAPHPDDIAVDRFAVALKAKLAKKRAEGYRGWDDKEACSNGHLSLLLVEHVHKGDPVDIGNLAMMLHQRGEVVADDRERYAAAVARNPLRREGR